MLVQGEEATRMEERVRLINFDWAGKEGSELRHPFHGVTCLLLVWS